MTSAKVASSELRFFGGLTVDETAEVLKVSPATVMRDWGFAKRSAPTAVSGLNPSVRSGLDSSAL
jgi:ECF sigma factor